MIQRWCCGRWANFNFWTRMAIELVSQKIILGGNTHRLN